MQYPAHFGMQRRAFQLSPDPQFFVATAQHRRVMGEVVNRLEADAVGAVIVSRAGLGKTILLGALSTLMQEKQATVTSIALPPGHRGGLFDLLARRLSLGYSHDAELLAMIEAHFIQLGGSGSRFSLLILDDAHRLRDGALLQLQGLVRAVRASGRPFAALLAGRPGLAKMLGQAPRDVARDFAISELGLLPESDQLGYVEGRLRLAGWSGEPSLGEGFAQALNKVGQGSPRTINYIMARALSEAAIDDRKIIEGSSLVAAAQELSSIRRKVRGLDAATNQPQNRKALRGLRLSLERIAVSVRQHQRKLAAIEAIGS